MHLSVGVLNNYLFFYFEALTDEKLKQQSEVTVATSITTKFFKNALYSVSSVDSIYASIRKKYTDVASGTEESFGTDKEWHYLAEKLEEYHSLSAVTNAMFGSVTNLSVLISNVLDEGDPDKYWYLWLSLKVFGARENHYLTAVLQNSITASDLEEHIYFDLLKTKHNAAEFKQYYVERKRLIESVPENLNLLDQYLSKSGIYGKDAVWYYTNNTDKEKLEFMQCMSTYDYSEDELLQITKNNFPELYCYLQNFKFNTTNTKLPASASGLWDALTEYFHQYKLQKVTNRIFSEFSHSHIGFCTYENAAYQPQICAKAVMIGCFS